MLAPLLTKPVFFQGRQLLLTYRALLDVEALAAVPAMQVNLAQLSATVLRAVLYAMLRASGSDLSPEACGEFFADVGEIGKIRKLVTQAWAASMPDPVPQEPADPDAEPEPRATTLDTWAEARFDLRLSDEEFLAITPRMFHALSRRRLEAIRVAEVPIAILAAHSVNHSFHAPQHPTQPRKYMAHPWPFKEAAPKQLWGEDIMRATAGMKKETIN